VFPLSTQSPLFLQGLPFFHCPFTRYGSTIVLLSQKSKTHMKPKCKLSELSPELIKTIKEYHEVIRHAKAIAEASRTTPDAPQWLKHYFATQWSNMNVTITLLELDIEGLREN